MQTPVPLDKVTIRKIFADINLKFFSSLNIFSIFSMWSHKAFVLGLMQHVSAIWWVFMRRNFKPRVGEKGVKLAPLVYRKNKKYQSLIEHL